MRLCAQVMFLSALVAAAAAGEVPEQFRVWGGRAKADAYLADPGLDGPGTVPVEATADEAARGFIVFGRMPGQPLPADYSPCPGERLTVLEARDAPGQYGPLLVGLVALGFGDFSLAVTDLEGPGGARIGAEHFQARAVRYVRVLARPQPQIIPLLLEAVPRKFVAAGRTQPFWITYHVPDDARAGLYEGRLKVLAGGVEKLAVPLRLEVYPFRLVEPDVSLYMYSNPSSRLADAAAVERQLRDQRCHGMNLATMTMPVTGDGHISRDAVVPWLDLYARVGFARKHFHVGLWNRITAEWLNTPDASIGMNCPWFRYYPFSERLDRRFVETVRMLRDEAKARGMELVLSVADEPGSHPWTTEAAQHYNDLVKTEVPDVLRELTVGGGWAMDRPEHELWKGRINIWTTNRWLPDRLALVRAGDPRAVIQVYNMAGDGSGPGGLESVRAFFGFFLWKTGAAGAAQWVYYHSATPSCNYTWPADDPAQGNVPTIRWELAREGAKDRRYLATLEAALAGKTGPAADEARALLKEIASQIDLSTDQYDPIGGGRVRVQPAGTYDRWRSMLADSIRRLGRP